MAIDPSFTQSNSGLAMWQALSNLDTWWRYSYSKQKVLFMSGKRYPEEFKIETVKQVTDRGYKVGDLTNSWCKSITVDQLVISE